MVISGSQHPLKVDYRIAKYIIQLWVNKILVVVVVVVVTLGARDLHAPHPDGRPKAGKTSGQHKADEVSEVLVASYLWFRSSFPSQNLTLELSQRCDSWSNRFYPCHT